MYYKECKESNNWMIMQKLLKNSKLIKIKKTLNLKKNKSKIAVLFFRGMMILISKIQVMIRTSKLKRKRKNNNKRLRKTIRMSNKQIKNLKENKDHKE